MIRTKRWMLLGLLFVALALPVLASEYNPINTAKPGVERARGHHGGLGYGPGDSFYAIASRLDLSQEQIDRLRDLRERQISETGPLRNELLQKRLEMRKLFADPAIDEATILAKQREIETITQKLHEKMTQFRLEQRRVLRPDQLKQLNEIATNRGFGRCPG